MSEVTSHHSSAAPVDTGGASPAVPPARPRRAKWITRLGLIGPAFIAGAWQFGPGNLTSAVQAGSGYGYALIWVIVVSTILMIFFTDMSVRIGLTSSTSLIQTIKDTMGRPVGVLAGIGVFFITLMFSVGNAVGSGLALNLLFGGSTVMWTVICTIAVAAILLLRRIYRIIERILVLAVVVMSIGFVVSAFASHPSWSQAVGGLVPEFPSGTGLLIIALVGTNFSINAAFFTGYGTRARKLRRESYRDITITDTIPGIVAPGVMTALVIVVSAAVLGNTGTKATSLPGLAAVFEPLAGPVGTTLFAIGFFGAAFSSMLANATAGGTLLSDGLGWGGAFDSVRSKLLVGVVLAFGMIVTIIAAGRSPVQLIVYAQAMTVLVAPLLGILIVIVANNPRVLGDLRNRWWHNLFAAIGLVAIVSTSVRLIIGIVS